jgi:hypothetical protein
MTTQSMKTLFFAAAALAFATSAHAQATRTWVSGAGNDADPCTQIAPCKTFQGALVKTAPKGEINVMGSGDYGGVTITKAITIDGSEALAGILVRNGHGIVVNAGASDIVTLRNLKINGFSEAADGILYITGAQVNVEDCKISHFTSCGIEANMNTAGKLTITNTIITDCTKGLRVFTTASSLFTSADNLKIVGSVAGVDASSGFCQMINSTVTKCPTVGLLGQAGTLSFTNGAVTSCGTGVRALNGATIRVANDDILDNGLDFAATGTGKIATGGNNRTTGNSVPNATINVQ